MRRLMAGADFTVVGAGIVGCAAAAFLAEAGAAVEVHERAGVAAGASGRNSGAIQHPFDRVLGALHDETLAIYRGLDGFELPPAPAGLLMLAGSREALAETVRGLTAEVPELRPELIDAGALAREEPSLAPGLAACRLETAWPVRPEAATHALAELARRRGVRFRIGEAPGPGLNPARTLLAAGPWAPELAPGLPIAPLWGAVAEVELERPPHHVVEEAGVESIEARRDSGLLFSLVTAAGANALGSTFTDSEPDHAALAPRLREHGARFVPALATAPIRSTRACARPLSADGRPLLGRLPDGRWVCAGHGPWGISTGPASARLVTDAMLGRDAEIPPALDVARFVS
jgi:glycine/D-amino acid oxidase-like deaminating enzyme